MSRLSSTRSCNPTRGSIPRRAREPRSQSRALRWWRGSRPARPMHRARRSWGTEGSNPAPSSGESANDRCCLRCVFAHQHARADRRKTAALFGSGTAVQRRDRLPAGGSLCGRPPRVKGVFGLGLSCRLQVCVRPVRAAMPLALMDCPPPEAPIWISRLMRIPSQRVCLGSRSD